jgi:hypothetical protein
MSTLTAKSRIAWFSVLPGDEGAARSHSAWTSSILLPILRHWFDIELFHDSFESYQDYVTHHYLRAAARDDENRFDVFVYQLEDCHSARFCRVHAALKPGLVWFHDYLFTSFGPEPILNSNWQYFVTQSHERVPSFSERGLEWKQQGPHGCREGSVALAALFSNQAQLADFRAKALELPHLTSGVPATSYLPIPVPSIERYSGSPQQGRIAWCGSPRVEHRSHKILGAFDRLRSVLGDNVAWYCTWLVEESEVEAATSELAQYPKLGQFVQIEQGRSPEQWTRLLLRSDIALHPYFSVFGQLSPYIQVSMQRGMPVITTAFAATDGCPSELVFKVRPGEHESYEISAALESLVTGHVSAPSHQLAAYASELFDPRSVATGFASFIELHLPEIQTQSARWRRYEEAARAAVLAELETVAPGSGSNLDALLLPVRRALTPLCSKDAWLGIAL